MANTFTNKIILDGWRNAVVQISAVLDTSDAVLTPAVTLSDFTNNDTANKQFVGFRFDHIWHAIGDGLEIQILWNGINSERVVAIAGRGRETFSSDGGLCPKMANPGYDGSINVISTGFATVGSPIQNFTLQLTMVKLYSVPGIALPVP